MNMDFMKKAIDEARIAEKLNEVPVGAIIVKNDKIIGAGHNMRELLKDPTAHAEIMAIKKAAETLGDWRLTGCDMYVTLEPCPMCAGAIIQSRITRLFIGTFDPNAGCCGSVLNITQNEALNAMVDVKWMYNEECSDILTSFFKKRR